LNQLLEPPNREVTVSNQLSHGAQARRATPPLPATSGELITALAHYHRAEIARMAGWRDRIDRTTNWAITAVAAMLSVSLSTPTAHHGVLLFAMVVVLLMLSIEARRYRFFDVYRTRVRRLERNYYAEIFDPREVRQDWARTLGEDLRKPEFLMSRRAALARRLRRNYGWMFLILLFAWVLKITSSKLQIDGAHRDFAQSLEDILRNSALGPIPGAAVLLIVAAFYGWLCYATFCKPTRPGELAYGEVHV
jgi:uncharacterized membrane protein